VTLLATEMPHVCICATALHLCYYCTCACLLCIQSQPSSAATCATTAHLHHSCRPCWDWCSLSRTTHTALAPSPPTDAHCTTARHLPAGVTTMLAFGDLASTIGNVPVGDALSSMADQLGPLLDSGLAMSNCCSCCGADLGACSTLCSACCVC
jgi:hypothetical protein